MKILFMGTPDFAQKSLEAIYNAKHEIIGVVTNIDKPKGRGMKLMCSPVKQFALDNNIEVYQPEKIRNNTEFIDSVKILNPDLICVVAYGKILPKDLLEIPKYGCINVHASLLPKYRGAAPIQWAVLNGDEETGVTTMFMDEGMDTGDMLLKKLVKIGKDETTGELWERLGNIGAELLVETINKISDGTIKREKQGNDFSMAPMLDKSMAKINWEEYSAVKIKNLVRGLNPIMGAYTFLGDKKIKFHKINIISFDDFINNMSDAKEYSENFKKLQPGTVVFSDDKKGLIIKALDDFISVIEIQGEGARKMNFSDFLRGNNIEIGNIFE